MASRRGASSAAGDRRCDRELEFVDDVGGEQGLRDRDACVDADIAAGLLLELADEVDQVTVDGGRVGPVPVERRRCRDDFATPSMNVANGSMSLLGQNNAHSS